MEKTVEQITQWWEDCIQQEIATIPIQVINKARERPEFRRVLAESIARKRCFQVSPVDNYLRNNLHLINK